MGRAILPELAIALVLLLLCGLVLVGIGAAQWAAGLEITRWHRDRHHRRAVEREQDARRAATWEPRTRYPGTGVAVVDVVRIARWDRREAVIDTAGEPVTVPAGDDDKRVEAQTAAWLRAAELNGLS